MEEINDRHEIYHPYKASCTNCRNGFSIFNFTCKAFSREIPDEILSGDNKHLKPLKDQGNELIFSPKALDYS